MSDNIIETTQDMESQALSDLSSMDTTEVTVAPETANGPANIETNQVDNTNVADGGENPVEGINLDEVDLGFLGINPGENTAPNPGEIVETPKPAPQDGQPNQFDEIKDLISGLNQTQENQHQLPQEEAAAVTELFDKFKQLGLIDSNNGLSEEDKTLLQEAKEIRDNLKQTEQTQKNYEEHQTKLNNLNEFDKKLATTIPGYNSEFMQKVVGDINNQNPEAAMKIFNNPSLLIDLWNEVGAKAQPQEKPSNVIPSNGQHSTAHNSLEEKVMNGTATEQEEADWLASGV